MNWLNKLDDVLENALTASKHGRTQGENRNEHQQQQRPPNADDSSSSSSSSESSHEAPTPRALPSGAVPGMPGRVRRQRPTPPSTPTGKKARYPGSLKRTTTTKPRSQPGKPVARRRLPPGRDNESLSDSDKECEHMQQDTQTAMAMDDRSLEGQSNTGLDTPRFPTVHITTPSGDASNDASVASLRDDERTKGLPAQESGEFISKLRLPLPNDSNSGDEPERTSRVDQTTKSLDDRSDTAVQPSNNPILSLEAEVGTRPPVLSPPPPGDASNDIPASTSIRDSAELLSENESQKRFTQPLPIEGGNLHGRSSEPETQHSATPSDSFGARVDAGRHDGRKTHWVDNPSDASARAFVEPQNSTEMKPTSIEQQQVVNQHDDELSRGEHETPRQSFDTLKDSGEKASIVAGDSLKSASVLDRLQNDVERSPPVDSPRTISPVQQVLDAIASEASKIEHYHPRITNSVSVPSERTPPKSQTSEVSETNNSKASQLVDPTEDVEAISNDKKTTQFNTDTTPEIIAPIAVTNTVLNSKETTDKPERAYPDIPRDISKADDFEAGLALRTWSAVKGFDPRTMNCHGTIHLRIFRAQRLPCTVGSKVQAVVSLKPWKGKVHTPKTHSFHGPTEETGVCAKWEESDMTMVHSYSSDESPTPSIHIDLRFSPLGMFGFSMGSLTLNCEPLLMSPNVAKRNWFSMTTSEATVPLLEIEAVFRPTREVNFSENKETAVPVDYVEVIERSASFVTSVYEEVNPGRPRLASDSPSDTGSLRNPPSISAQSQKTALHLLRLKTFRTPAKCCVCQKSIMSGLWTAKAFRCEECLIDCCADCRLNVDVKIPCGSDLSAEIVSKAIQNNLSVDRVLRMLAPVDQSKELEPAVGGSTLEDVDNRNVQVFSEGIGTLSIGFIQCFVLEESTSPDTDSADVLGRKQTTLRKGDYYMRVTRVSSDDTARTHTIQNTGKPKFDSEDFLLNVPHYGSEFRIELVDAATDKTLGTELLPTQSLLQQQRDYLIEECGVIDYYRSLVYHKCRRRLRISLRFDMNTASSFQFFSSPKPASQSAKTRKGDIVGYADIQVGLDENFGQIFGKSPYLCPPRPADELDLNLFQVHLGRISELVEDLKAAIAAYAYVVSWKNPLVTGLSFAVFVHLCSRFDPHYFGSLPTFLVVAGMVVLGIKRLFRKQKDRFTQKEAETRRKAETVEVDYSLHRPFGRIGITLVRGRNIRSVDMGLPGSVGCHIAWDPKRLMTSSEKKRFETIDQAATVVHEIGSTNYVYSTKPAWDVAKESTVAKRLRTLIPADDDALGGRKPNEGCELVFPVLQPFVALKNDQRALEPWAASKAALSVEVRFNDVLSVLPGSEYVLGEVCIPFSDLCMKGEISGWFHIRDIESKEAVPAKDDDGSPQVFLKLRWTPPVDTAIDASDTDREISVFVQEEMIRSAVLNRQQKLGFVGSSIGALNTVRGLGTNLLMVQNTLGFVLDVVEASRNAVNFTDPVKSSVLLGVAILLWLFFCIVPVRAIFYALGVLQYTVTFIDRFSALSSTSAVQEKESSNPSPVVVWLLNGFRGIPTNEDLRKTYFWESSSLGAKEAELFSREKRKKRLQTLWKAQWYSSVQIASEETTSIAWENVFAVVQGHRFLWWGSTKEFDDGLPPRGRVFLAGHAGLATPSPLELRAIQKEDVDRVVCLFGKGTDRQERITMLAPSIDLKRDLERAVENALSNKAD